MIYANRHFIHFTTQFPIMPITNAKQYAARIEDYFKYIKGSYHYEQVPVKGTKDETSLKKEKVWDREPEPAMVTGLALHVGFNSVQQMDAACKKGKLAKLLKQARLRVEKEYERKLHMQAPTGAIFALKTMGWKERDNNAISNSTPSVMSINVFTSGPVLANSEKDVDVNA